MMFASAIPFAYGLTARTALYAAGMAAAGTAAAYGARAYGRPSRPRLSFKDMALLTGLSGGVSAGTNAVSSMLKPPSTNVTVQSDVAYRELALKERELEFERESFLRKQALAEAQFNATQTPLAQNDARLVYDYKDIPNRFK